MADFPAISIRPSFRAPVRSVSPAAGSQLGATFQAARWQKVTVTVREFSDGREVLITLKFKGSSLRHVVYDASGFAPMFSTFSKRTGNVFEILPSAGWHREPERLWVGEAVEAAI